MQRARALLSDTRGTAAVEFAIVASVFLIFVLGLLAYGIYFGTAHSVSQLAADAARASVAGIDDTERATLAKSHITNNASHFMFIDPAKLSSKSQQGPVDLNQFSIEITYDASALPIWFMSGVVPLPPKTIVRSASIMRGGY